MTKSVALTCAALVTLALSPRALADGDDPVFPSQEQVDRARASVTDAERSVEAIQADLAAANQQLEQLGVAAEQASEAYNGAMWHWQQARAEARTAKRRAASSATNAETARTRLAGLVLSHDMTGSDLDSIGSAFRANGPQRLMAQMSQHETSSQALDSTYQEWEASAALAKVYEADAAAALDRAERAKHEANQAKIAAQQAVATQQAAVVAIDAQRQSLIEELARAQNISVDLARQRQEGLEEQRRQELAEQRRLEALRQQRIEQRQAEEQARQQRIEERRQERVEERRQQRRERRQRQNDAPEASPPTQHTNPAPAPSPSPKPKPAPKPEPAPAPQPAPSPPPSSSNPQAAVSFAYAQLGEPYVWGGDGPDTWDCSGLTMGAWANAGRSLPHYSVSQYYATTPISSSELQPGDLVFWASDSSNPDTIFHVGLYIGNGNMIHAPRTGVPVKVESIWYWETPDFFGRP